MNDRIKFDRQAVIVTGAGNGIGLAHALELGRRGAHVIVNDLGTHVTGEGSSREPAEHVVAQITAQGGTAIASFDSVATPDGAEATVRLALDTYGRVDVVIHNAGIFRLAAVSEAETDDIERHLDVHLRGGIYLARAAYQHMCDRRYGRFVFTSSHAIFGGPGLLAYATAKAGMLGLSRVIALEGANRDIMSNVVFPVATTRMTTSLTTAQAEDIRATGAVPALGSDPAQHISALVLYLASQDCADTGSIFYASSGRFGRVVMSATGGWSAGSCASADDVLANIDAVRAAEDLYEPLSSADFDRRGARESAD